MDDKKLQKGMHRMKHGGRPGSGGLFEYKIHGELPFCGWGQGFLGRRLLSSEMSEGEDSEVPKGIAVPWASVS